jgi:hypothetical protein
MSPGGQPPGDWVVPAAGASRSPRRISIFSFIVVPLRKSHASRGSGDSPVHRLAASLAASNSRDFSPSHRTSSSTIHSPTRRLDSRTLPPIAKCGGWAPPDRGSGRRPRSRAPGPRGARSPPCRRGRVVASLRHGARSREAGPGRRCSVLRGPCFVLLHRSNAFTRLFAAASRLPSGGSSQRVSMSFRIEVVSYCV